MLKRLGLALAGLFAFAQLALASGTIPFSLSQQFDALGKPLAGCRLYTIQAGTTSTPQNAYQDSALTLALPNPQTCDAAGRLPQMFLADGSIKVRLTDKNGVTQVVADGIQVIGPSGGGGGGSTVDATTVLATGDTKQRWGTGALTGWVRLNGRTIGSATSGATERANADCQALFEYLWSADSNLTVSTGRGASANADWVANKTLTLPDGRGRVLAGIDDMGAGDSTTLASVPFTSGNQFTLGAKAGAGLKTLAQNNLPNVTLSASVSGTVNVTANASFFQTNLAPQGFTVGSGGSTAIAVQQTASTFSTPPVSSGSNSLGGSTSSINGGTTQAAFSGLQPTLMVTYYIKL